MMHPEIPEDIAAARQSILLAIGHMQSGRLVEAEALCLEILRQRPKEAGVHHLLGLLNYQMGKHDAAIDFIRQAILLNPNEAEYQSNLGVVLLAAGRVEEAVAAGLRAVGLREAYPEAQNNLGNALAAAGRIEEALKAYERALRDRPGFADALNNRGNVLKRLGRLDDAVADYQQAIVQRPDYAGAHANLGIALQFLGRGEEAISCYQKVVALRPADSEARRSLGGLLFDAKKWEESLACYGQAVAIRPGFAEAFNDMGIVLQRLGRIEDAIANHERALKLRPDLAEAHTALGTALRQMGRLDEAMECYRRALALRPQSADAMTFLGAALQERDELEEAIAMHRRAIAVRPNHYEAHLNLALVLLSMGNFREGWPEYEWRRRNANSCGFERDFSVPQWHGEELEGRRILIHAEQGLGDAMQFVRYVPLVTQRGGKVVLECFGELERLFRGLKGAHELVKAGEPLPAFDLHCPMLSLPLAFGMTMETIPAGPAYLHADEDLQREWLMKMEPVDGRMKVGLAWAGRATHRNDRNRSIPLGQFKQLGKLAGVRYFSLQKDRGGQPPNVNSEFEMTDWTAELADFADTAALVANLDLVITVDSAVAHLAGAMGKPAWVLLPHPADFRWLRDREDSPWYPTLRLFRQRRSRDWTEPLARVTENLQRLASS